MRAAFISRYLCRSPDPSFLLGVMMCSPCRTHSWYMEGADSDAVQSMTTAFV